jgi:hypothetical protein
MYLAYQLGQGLPNKKNGTAREILQNRYFLFRGSPNRVFKVVCYTPLSIKPVFLCQSAFAFHFSIAVARQSLFVRS